MSNEQKTKHTPGPYHISHDEDGGTTIRDDDDLIMAGVYGFAAPDREGQEEANGTLLAAAPELLAALKAAREIAASRADPEHCMHYGEINWTQVRDEFSAAIAKAEAE